MKYQIGQRVSGEYYEVSWIGVIETIEANWEVGSRDALNLYVKLDVPIEIGGMVRYKLAFLGVNPKTGRRFWKGFGPNWQINLNE